MQEVYWQFKGIFVTIQDTFTSIPNLMRKLASALIISTLFVSNVSALTLLDTTGTTSTTQATSGTTQVTSPAPAPAPTPTTASTTSTQQATTNIFSDVPQTHPNYVAINYLKSQGILGGYPDGTFKPDALVNRAEALKILLIGNKVEIPSAVSQVSFSDYKVADWFAKYVEQAKTLGIVNGNPDGTFAPARNVVRAEFMKMLLILNTFKADKWAGQSIFADVPKDAWFAPYMNYAGQSGLITKDEKNMLYPAKALTRGDVAEIMYLMIVIRSDKNTQFLIDQTEAQMGQIEVYIAAKNVVAAKRASELAVDFSQQAYTNMPTDTVVLSAAKLAKAYDYLMNAFITAVQKDYVNAKNWAEMAIAKATEAWEVNHDIQPIAKHIKDRANEILNQISVS